MRARLSHEHSLPYGTKRKERAEALLVCATSDAQPRTTATCWRGRRSEQWSTTAMSWRRGDGVIAAVAVRQAKLVLCRGGSAAGPTSMPGATMRAWRT